MTYKIEKIETGVFGIKNIRPKIKKEKTFRILVRGDDMYDKPFTEVIEIKAKSEKEAISEAKSQNGVYEAEIV
jgi:hypothetical protein